MHASRRWTVAPLLTGMGIICGAGPTQASDHLDSPTVAMNPRADIGDLYAWTSSDGRRLNLALTIVGQSFSEHIEYAFHVESGKRFGAASDATHIVCRFSANQTVNCRAGADAGRFDVFAGKRDDPFFNNVRGTRAAYQKAKAALENGTTVDAAGCPKFDAATTQAILDEWRHTDGGPARNFLAGWVTAALVVAIDLSVVAKNGAMLAVWATTSSDHGQIDRMGRPLTGNALLATLGSAIESDRLKEQYNSATPAAAARFAPEIEKSLGLYDGFDGVCGNQLLAAKQVTGMRYRELATVLADDRLWVNSAASVCKQFFAVELGLTNDCGGRTPTHSAVNAYRSLLAVGAATGIDDGLERDEVDHSSNAFPFLAAP
jgi:hypothetical protein